MIKRILSKTWHWLKLLLALFWTFLWLRYSLSSLIFDMSMLTASKLLKNVSRNSFKDERSMLRRREIISIFHGCMVWIEKSFTRVTDRHHEGCRVMQNSDPEWQIFLSTPYTHDRYFFLHTFWLTTFDFQSRTCYEITVFPLKGFYLSLKKSTLPATAVRVLYVNANLHKVTSFSDVTAVKNQRHLTT